MQLSVSLLFQFWYAQNHVGVSFELREYLNEIAVGICSNNIFILLQQKLKSQVMFSQHMVHCTPQKRGNWFFKTYTMMPSPMK